MATDTRSEKVMFRQARPGATVRSEPTPPPAAEPATEPTAQWQDNIGDRVTYLVWLFCFGAMLLYVLAETVLGFLFW